MKIRSRICLYIISLFLILFFLGGCSYLLEREFVFEEPHVSTDDEEGAKEDVLELTSYDGLQEALLVFIENHDFVQTVRLSDYTGNVESDVQQAVRDVMTTPLGAFAVTNIAYQSSRILSYYEIRFDISYRRTAQEISEMKQIESMEELESFLAEKLSQFSGSMIFRIDDYTQSRYDFEKLLMDVYYENPQAAYGFESMETHYYPESGMARIVELTVSYAQQPATLAAKSATATDEAQIILDSYIGSKLTANRLKYFYDTICSSVEFDSDTAQLLKESEKTLSKTDPFTVYGALIKKSAVGEGFALAFKQLCDMADIDCIVVSGKRDGAPHMWNLVLNRGEWSHVDCSYDAGDDVLNYTVFGLTDEEMPSQYTWDRNAYPEAASHVLREMLSLPVDEPVNGEGSASMESTVDDETTIVAEEISSDEERIVSDAGTED